ncbi:MAG TPA: energy transducer TonB [Longimicrobium sp.]
MKRALAAVFAASLLAGCAGAPPAASPPASRPAAAARRPADPDPPLPVAAFIDSAALHQALLGAPLAPPDFRRRPLFSVEYDSTGALKSVEPVSARLIPAEYGRTMAALLRTHVAPRLATPRETFQRVWLQSGPTPKIEVLGNAVAVRPDINNRSVVAAELGLAVQRLLATRPGLAGRRATAQVRIRVSDAGLPESSVVERSTGDPAMDRAIIAVARRMRFSPARLDEYPVKVLVTVPITLVFPDPLMLPSAGASNP